LAVEVREAYGRGVRAERPWLVPDPVMEREVRVVAKELEVKLGNMTPCRGVRCRLMADI
jgi:hypothetical protein